MGWLPSGGPIAQALVAQKVDIGPIGVTPLLNLLLNNQKVTPLAVAEGRLKFVIAVRDGSPVQVGFDDGRAALMLADAAGVSAREGRTVSVDLQA